MRPTPHLPYSPDLVPPDFYRFGYVKGCLPGLSFEAAEQLLEAVHAVLEAIKKQRCKPCFWNRWAVCGNVSLSIESIPTKLK
jgi:hypothetical protein